MKSDDRRRLAEAEERLEAELAQRAERPTGSGRAILEDMLRVDQITYGWDYYDPEQIMYAANSYIESFSADIEEMREEYRLTVGDEPRRHLATRARAMTNLVNLLIGVRGDAARDLGRAITPYFGRFPLLEVSNMSPADLIALGLARHKEKI
jgi:hypothetical protein